MTENQISSQYMYIEIVTGLTLLQICKVSQLFRTGKLCRYVGGMASFLRLRKTEIYASDNKFADQWHT